MEYMQNLKRLYSMAKHELIDLIFGLEKEKKELENKIEDLEGELENEKWEFENLREQF